MTPKKCLMVSVLIFGLFPAFGNGAPQSEAWRALARLKAGDYYSEPVQVELAEALAHGNAGRLNEIIKRGADVNAKGRDGMRPLFWAMAKKNPKGFEILLENGADPNVTIGSLVKDERPPSVMELAAIAENPIYLRLALKHGGNANLPMGYGDRTVIYEAIMNNRLENVRILAEAGADLAHRDTSGVTPMATAATINNYDMVYLLLDRGADPTLKDRWGYDLARLMKTFGTRGIKPGSEQHKWYLKVVTEMKKRDLL